MGMRGSFGFVVGLIYCSSVQAVSVYSDPPEVVRALESIQIDELKPYVSFLASDTLRGREAGEAGGAASGSYLVSKLREIGLDAAGDGGDYYQVFGKSYRNILAVLPGSDPVLKDEYVLIGGHYDHVGLGDKKTSKGMIGLVHNGADDNASGVSCILELAEAFSLMKDPPKRSLLFVFWDAEEKGLLGSSHWVRNPTVPLKSIKMMINLDMIGRLRAQTLTVYGTRTAPGLRRLVSTSNVGNHLKFRMNWNNRSDSDHYPFYVRGIPYLMFFTGLHDDYHTQKDDVNKVNFKGIHQISQVIFRVMWRAANHDQLPRFRLQSRGETELVRRVNENPPPLSPTRLGAAWDATLAKEQGVIRITDIRENSPADQAGLQMGDEIRKLGDHTVTSEDQFHLALLASPNKVTLWVKRPGVLPILQVKIQLLGNPIRIGFSWRQDNAEPHSIVLTRVVTGSAADQAGLKAFDRILTVEGKTIQNGPDFLKLVQVPGNTLKLEVERNGQICQITLKLLPPNSPEKSGSD